MAITFTFVMLSRDIDHMMILKPFYAFRYQKHFCEVAFYKFHAYKKSVKGVEEHTF